MNRGAVYATCQALGVDPERFLVLADYVELGLLTPAGKDLRLRLPDKMNARLEVARTRQKSLGSRHVPGPWVP